MPQQFGPPGMQGGPAMPQMGGPPGGQMMQGPGGQHQMSHEQLAPAFSVEDVEDKDGVRLSWNVWSVSQNIFKLVAS